MNEKRHFEQICTRLIVRSAKSPGCFVVNLTRLAPSFTEDDSLQLQNFLEGLDEAGGQVHNEVDADGNVSVLFVSSRVMKEAFLKSSCTTLQVDTSFDFDASKYKLCAICYLNPTNNRAELGALAFLAEETAVNFRSAFKFFKDMCAESPPSVFIVDKDFTEITVLKEVFTRSTILLCLFHLIKYAKNLLTTARVTVEINHDEFQSKSTLIRRRSMKTERMHSSCLLLAPKYVPLSSMFR